MQRIFHLDCAGVSQNDLEFLLSSDNKYFCKECTAFRRRSIRTPPPSVKLVDREMDNNLRLTNSAGIQISEYDNNLSQQQPQNTLGENVKESVLQTTLSEILCELKSLKSEQARSLTMLHALQADKCRLIETTENLHSDLTSIRKQCDENIANMLASLSAEVKQLRRCTCHCTCLNNKNRNRLINLSLMRVWPSVMLMLPLL